MAVICAALDEDLAVRIGHVEPVWRAGVFRGPADYANNDGTWHRVGADQVLIVRVQQDDPVKYHQDVAVIGELLEAECPRVATGRATSTRRYRTVDAVAAAKRAVSGRVAATATSAHGGNQRCC